MNTNFYEETLDFLKRNGKDISTIKELTICRQDSNSKPIDLVFTWDNFRAIATHIYIIIKTLKVQL